jgi:hypothetical protein
LSRPSFRIAQHVRFQSELKTSKLDGLYSFDFVTLDGLGPFLDTEVIAFSERVAGVLTSNPLLLASKAILPEKFELRR